MRKYVAELIGTFTLVFCGTGAVVINQQTGGAVTHIGVAITWGLVVMSMIYALGDVSGAHMNPAVSIAFAVAGRFRASLLPGYITSQLAGALLASFTLKLLFPSSPFLGATLPAGPQMQSFVLELLLTFFLMLVCRYSNRLSSGFRGHVCRACMRGFHESGAVNSPRHSIRPFGTSLDLYCCPHSRCDISHTCLEIFELYIPSENIKTMLF
jgi:glycerol uptake facilitator-like aquaporin